MKKIFVEKKKIYVKWNIPTNVDEWSEHINIRYQESSSCMAPTIIEHCHFPNGVPDRFVVSDPWLGIGEYGWSPPNRGIGHFLVDIDILHQ